MAYADVQGYSVKTRDLEIKIYNKGMTTLLYVYVQAQKGVCKVNTYGMHTCKSS